MSKSRKCPRLSNFVGCCVRRKHRSPEDDDTMYMFPEKTIDRPVIAGNFSACHSTNTNTTGTAQYSASIEKDHGEPERICTKNETINKKGKQKRRIYAMDAIFKGDPKIWLVLESSSTEDDTMEVFRFLMQNKLVSPERLSKKVVKDKKTRKSPLKTFKKVTLSFIERPKKSTQTCSQLNLDKNRSTQTESPKECEPNLESDLPRKLSLDGAAAILQVGSSDAEQISNIPAKYPTQPQTKQNQETNEEIQIKDKNLVGDVLALTLSSQIAVCSIKRALESAFEADELYEGISDYESDSSQEFSDSENALLLNYEHTSSQKTPRHWCTICAFSDKEAFGTTKDIVSESCLTHDGRSNNTREAPPARAQGSQTELMSTLPCESKSDLSSLATSCTSLEWDAYEYENRHVQYDAFIIPVE